jgi:DNA polymerase bacteriophage-type
LDALQRADLRPEVRQLIELRLNGAAAATKKLKKLRAWMDPQDHRVRQAFRFHGASTGRWTSIGIQAQNFAKPSGVADVQGAVDAIRTGDLKQLQAKFERPLDIINVTRSMIVPAPGHRFFVADLSGVESRGLAWVVGETRKLNDWRRFDQTQRPEDEPYAMLAAASGPTGDNARAQGKVMDLAFQYLGGRGAWRRLAGPKDETDDETIKTLSDVVAAAAPEHNEILDDLSARRRQGHQVPRATFPRRQITVYLGGRIPAP